MSTDEPQKQANPAQELPPVAIYGGKVMHARLKPKRHRFTYRVFSILIDIDRLKDANKASRLLSINSANLFSFQESDHGKRDGSSLRNFIDEILSDAGAERPDQVLLWCNPRLFGYTFNPLSIYYCFDIAGAISAVVYQVHNTFGESHCYVATVPDGKTDGDCLKQSADKVFHVSPFLDMDLRYDFRLNMPGDDLRIRILEHDAQGPILAATFAGSRKTCNSSNLLIGMLKTLGFSWKIVSGIHIEALFLWLKGIAVRPRPIAPKEVSYGRTGENIVAGE